MEPRRELLVLVLHCVYHMNEFLMNGLFKMTYGSIHGYHASLIPSCSNLRVGNR
uniref:Uncharacterized protein n=1 Tax=Lepeophtheirus salmonis TaxID=72036 RepID=A0A0K2TUB3_LEPSM